MISKKSNIAVIGAGKIAYSLVDALLKRNYKIKTIVSSNINSAKKLAEKFSITNYSNNLSGLNSQIKIFFLSIPDKQIKIVADRLANQNLNFHNSLFIHLSGAEDISNLNSLKKKGALTASFHIMQSFPSKRIVNINNCFAAIETENKYAENFLLKLAEDLQLNPFKLKSKDKALYHLAGIFASNFLVGNIFNSERTFDIKKRNVNYDNFDFLFPIIKTTLNNINKLGSSKALSGPIERGDLSTIRKHVSSLKKSKRNSEESNGIYLSYIIQSLNLLDVIKSKYGKLSEGHLQIREYLLSELKRLFVK